MSIGESWKASPRAENYIVADGGHVADPRLVGCSEGDILHHQTTLTDGGAVADDDADAMADPKTGADHRSRRDVDAAEEDGQAVEERP